MGATTRQVHRPDNSTEQGMSSSRRKGTRKRAADVLDPDSGALLRKAPVALLICDALGKITFANSLARKMAQVNPVGKTLNSAPGIWGEMFDQRGRHVPAAEWPCATAIRGETTNAKQYHLVRWDRSSYHLLISASPICARNSQIAGAMTVLTNISEQKRTEIALRGEAIWRERSRMAAEIHDSLLQGLNAIVLQLDAAEHLLKEDASQLRRSVSIALAQARQNITEARRSMWILSHPNFDSEDPGAAISFLARQLFQGSSITVELSLGDEPHPLSARLRRELVQIAKEAMINTLKHAQATRVAVELSYDFQAVRLSVSDDGRGFMHQPLSDTQQGYGLVSMRTRAENIGGKFLIDGRMGRGTRVSVLVPFSRLASAIRA